MDQEPRNSSGDTNTPIAETHVVDSISEIYSCGYLMHRIKNACKAFIKRRRPFALIIIDIDHFRCFNDEHGSDEGDRLLNKLVSMLKSYMRKGELLSSYGGDSFILILNEGDAGNCALRADAIRRKFLDKFQGESEPLTISIGVAIYPSTAIYEMELLAEARHALHISKKRGGNCATLYPSPSPGLPPAPGTSFPSYVSPPGRPPALSPGYEQELPGSDLSHPDDMTPL